MTTTTQRDFKSFGNGYLPGLVGVEIVTVSREAVESRMAVRREVMAPNGFLHAASVIALADTSCGYGCVRLLPAARGNAGGQGPDQQSSEPPGDVVLRTRVGGIGEDLLGVVVFDQDAAR